jgi:hypothetical protein
MLHNKIMAHATMTSGIKPGTAGFLGEFQKSTTVMLNALEPHELEIYVNAVKEWSADAPPPYVQSRLVHSVLSICYTHCLAF